MNHFYTDKQKLDIGSKNCLIHEYNKMNGMD